MERLSPIPKQVDSPRLVTRRRFLLLAGALGATALAAACSPSRPEQKPGVVGLNSPPGPKPEAPLTGVDRAGTAVAQVVENAPAVAPVAAAAPIAAKPEAASAPASVGDKLRGGSSVPVAPEKPSIAPPVGKPGAGVPEQKPAVTNEKPTEVVKEPKPGTPEYIAMLTYDAIINNRPRDFERLLSADYREKNFKGKPVTIPSTLLELLKDTKGLERQYSIRETKQSQEEKNIEYINVRIRFVDKGGNSLNVVPGIVDRSKKYDWVEITIRRDRTTGDLYNNDIALPSGKSN